MSILIVKLLLFVIIAVLLLIYQHIRYGWSWWRVNRISNDIVISFVISACAQVFIYALFNQVYIWAFIFYAMAFLIARAVAWQI